MKTPFSLAMLVVLSACGAAQSAAPQDQRLTADRLYPMRTGSVWTYDVDTGQGPPVLAITRVTREEGTKAEVTTGSDPIVYERRADGLYRADREAYILKLPIRVGSRWEAGGGATAEVRDVDKTVSSPAGEFRGCVEVLESGGAAGKVVRTVFCPDVGPVEVESSMSMSLTRDVARVLARLRGYDLSGALVE